MNGITEATNSRLSRSHPARSGNLTSAHIPATLPVRHPGDEAPIKVFKGVRVNPRLVCLHRSKTRVAEDYLRLRNAVENLRPANRGIVVGVTSPGKGEGKTLTAINLAGALAQDSSARVLLVDLDLRESGSKVQDQMGLKKSGGSGVIGWVREAISGSSEASCHFPEHNLYLTPSGSTSESPYNLLKSPRLDQFFALASQTYDFIVVDTPQILQLPDVELISRVVDGFLIVVKADSTPQHELEEALNRMSQDKVLGLVFNGVPSKA